MTSDPAAANRPSSARRTALVIGASSGIGAETARVLASDGFQVHLAGRRTALLEPLASELEGSFGAIDVTSEASVVAGIAAADEQLGGVDVAVYASGALEVQPVKRHSLEVWERILSVNLTGAFLVARELFERMRAGGRLIFVSSVAGRRGAPLMSAYSASKGGLERFAEGLAGELERRGVGVHVVSPDQVATPMLERPGTADFQLEPSQVAGVIAWLASLPPDVVVSDVELRAVASGPFVTHRHQAPDGATHDRPGV